MIKRSGQPWGAGLLGLLRSLGLPRKRFMLIGLFSVIFLMYTFINYSNAIHARLGFGIVSAQAPVDTIPVCISPLGVSPTVPPLNNQLPVQDVIVHTPPPSPSSSPVGNDDGDADKKEAMHPIPHLMEAAEAKWAAMLQRQSSTLDAAVKEYKRRYGMAPPDGFDLWFEYARSNNLKLVDEYDDLMATLAPLRRLGPKEARRRAENMLKFGFEESIGGLVIDAKDGVFSYWKDPKAEEEKRNRKKNKAAKRSLVEMEGEDEGGYRTRGLLRMLEPLKDVLGEKVAEWPAFAIPVNELAEARVVGGDDEKWKAQTDALETKKEKYELDDLWHRHQVAARTLSEDLIHACDANSRYGKMAVGTRFEFGIHEVLGSNGDLKGEGSKAEFVTDPNADNDMCERPELMALHGVHRGTRSTTKGLYPMLSYGHPSAFNDIAIPSRYQWDVDGSYEYYDGDDVAWEEKESKIYWRGEPSGGGHGDQYYGSMHRHRLVALTNPAHFKTSVLVSGASASGALIQSTEPAHIAQTLTNITFSDISSMCEMFGCDLPSIFPFEERNDFSEAWKNKLVIDSDGWGPSGRWRALMASKSTAIRSSIYREWFGERQMPWVHYVPASVGLGELWGLLGFFLGTSESPTHDAEARKIAEQGALWVKEHMRKQDMTIYCFRLVLELNRLFNGEEWVYKG